MNSVGLDSKGLPGTRRIPPRLRRACSRSVNAAHRTDCPRHVELEARSRVFERGVPRSWRLYASYAALTISTFSCDIARAVCRRLGSRRERLAPTAPGLRGPRLGSERLRTQTTLPSRTGTDGRQAISTIERRCPRSRRPDAAMNVTIARPHGDELLGSECIGVSQARASSPDCACTPSWPRRPSLDQATISVVAIELRVGSHQPKPLRSVAAVAQPRSPRARSPRSPATSPAQYPAGSGVGVSVLLRQAHGFEGLGRRSPEVLPAERPRPSRSVSTWLVVLQSDLAAVAYASADAASRATRSPTSMSSPTRFQRVARPRSRAAARTARMTALPSRRTVLRSMPAARVQHVDVGVAQRRVRHPMSPAFRRRRSSACTISTFSCDIAYSDRPAASRASRARRRRSHRHDHLAVVAPCIGATASHVSTPAPLSAPRAALADQHDDASSPTSDELARPRRGGPSKRLEPCRHQLRRPPWPR